MNQFSPLFFSFFLSFSHSKVVRVVLMRRASARALAPSAEILLPPRLSVEMYLSIAKRKKIRESYVKQTREEIHISDADIHKHAHRKGEEEKDSDSRKRKNK